MSERLIEDLIKTLKAAEGRLLNIRIDLETGATKRKAINAIDGAINMVRDALDTAEKRERL